MHRGDEHDEPRPTRDIDDNRSLQDHHPQEHLGWHVRLVEQHRQRVEAKDGKRACHHSKQDCRRRVAETMPGLVLVLTDPHCTDHRPAPDVGAEDESWVVRCVVKHRARPSRKLRTLLNVMKLIINKFFNLFQKSILFNYFYLRF